jgi:hypothetical protein
VKTSTLLALASASVLPVYAGGAPVAKAYYKVKINAEATLQTDFDETTNARVNTSDVIEALIDQLGVPSSKASDFDIIACYLGGDDDIMDAATYYLARTRGPADNRYKVKIPSSVFDTNGGEAVFKRVFTFNNSTVKVNITDAFSGLLLDTSDLEINASGLADAQVTVKDAGLGGNPYLSLVKNHYSGHHVIDVGPQGVGTINAKIEGSVKADTFDSLATILLP